jgi:hypothetical protein
VQEGCILLSNDEGKEMKKLTCKLLKKKQQKPEVFAPYGYRNQKPSPKVKTTAAYITGIPNVSGNYGGVRTLDNRFYIAPLLERKSHEKYALVDLREGSIRTFILRRDALEYLAENFGY